MDSQTSIRSRLAEMIANLRIRSVSCETCEGETMSYPTFGDELDSLADKLEALLASEVGELPQHCAKCGEPHDGECPYTRGGKQASGSVSSPPHRASGNSSALTMHEQQQVDDALNALGGCWSVNDYKGAQRVMAGFLREIQSEVRK